jgi:hypothetical protein
MPAVEDLRILRRHTRPQTLDLPTWGVLISIILLSIIFVSINLDLPVVRNSVLYAKISANLIKENFDLWKVNFDQHLGYGKPITFPLLSVPLTLLFGGNTGLILTSFLSTLFLLMSCIWLFFRLNQLLSLPRAALSVEFLVTFLNPLMLYQFWSAYPDTLFSAFFVLSFVLLDKILRDTEKTHLVIISYFAVTYFSITIKYYGLILLFIHPVYVFMNRCFLRNCSLPSGKKLTLLIAGFCFVCLLVLARLQLNPTLNLGPATGGGYQVYMEGVKNLDLPFHRNLACLFVFFAVTLNASAWLVIRGIMADHRLMPFAVTSVIFVMGLLIYPHMAFNIRFLIPIIPFLALAISVAVFESRFKNSNRKILLFSLALNLALSIYFNHQATFMFFEPYSKKLSGIQHSYLSQLFLKVNTYYLDSLRMREHIETQKNLANINQHIPLGATLYMVGVDYYEDSLHGTYEQLGFIRNDIAVKYVAAIDDIKSLEQDFYLFLWKENGDLHKVFDQRILALQNSLYKVVIRNSLDEHAARHGSTGN